MSVGLLARSTAYANSGNDVRSVLGSTEPRLWTRPLRALTPDTTVGFSQIEFARDTLRRPFDPWQEFLTIHGGELLPDGRPRFRLVIVLVARQNGKTETPVVLSLYWQFVDAFPLILGTSTKLDYAKESWKKAIRLAERTAKRNDAEAESIRKLFVPGRWYRETNGEQESWVAIDPDDLDGDQSRYKIAASNAEGGRSLTINRLVLDELRQHHDYSAYEAAEPATSAVWDAQIWAMSNAGDDNSVVLNELRDDAIKFIEWWDENGDPHVAELLLAGELPEGMPDYRVGLFEWSAPEDAEPTDIYALAQANPNMNRRIDGQDLLAKARRAMDKGGKALTGFRTEYMCIRVKKLDPAIEPAAWRKCLSTGELSEARSRIALCLDVAPDEMHASLIAAAVLPDDRVRVEAVEAWEGRTCLDDLRRELPAILGRVKPQTIGWIPNGPAAALAADLAVRKGRFAWPPSGVKVEEIRGEVAAICMGLAKEVKAGRIAHSDDPLINDHIGSAEKLQRGNVWVFSRKSGRAAGQTDTAGEGHCDAAYAVAGAVHLARTLPTPVGRPRLVTVPNQ